MECPFFVLQENTQRRTCEKNYGEKNYGEKNYSEKNQQKLF